jgi:hypothetical protein
MPISHTERAHGGCILHLFEAVHRGFPSVRFALEEGEDRSSYSVIFFDRETRKEFSIGLYLKYSRLRRSPWRFSFERPHQEEIDRLKAKHSEVFLIFVCDEDGYACIDYQDLKRILDDHFDDVEWVALTRKPNSFYRISGTDGAHDSPLPKNAFPGKILSFIKEALDG